MSKVEKRFRLSFAGNAEYEIYRDGRRVGVIDARSTGYAHWRYELGNNGRYNPGVWESDILPAIGTVRWASSSQWSEFPPADVVALFPGYVGARIEIVGDWPDSRVDWFYDGPRPVVVPHPTISEYLIFEPVESVAAGVA